MNKKNKSKLIFYIIFLAAAVFFGAVLLNNANKSNSVEKVRSLGDDEYSAICREYCLDPEKIKLDYIFVAGGNTFGVRIWLEDESVLENMNALFEGDILAEDNYYNLAESAEQVRMSDRITRDAARPVLSDEVSKRHGGEPVYCFVYRDDKGMYYMEMMTLATENEAIYRKNEK